MCPYSGLKTTSHHRARARQSLHGRVEILSVDDTPVNHLVLEKALKKTGFKFTRCDDGVEALELIAKRKYLPDLILLDVMMPRLSGYEVRRCLDVVLCVCCVGRGKAVSGCFHCSRLLSTDSAVLLGSSAVVRLREWSQNGSERSRTVQNGRERPRTV